MAARIEDYAFISDNHTGALVSKDGSIDWLCVPRIDSGAIFAALLGDESHGRWRVAPVGPARVRRRYRPGTLVLETEFTTDEGVARVIDFMPHRHRHPTLVRIVEGVSGTVAMELDLVLRFDYGWVVPWVREHEDGLIAVAGPDAVVLRTPVELDSADLRTTARFSVGAGDRVPFYMAWFDPVTDPPDPPEADELLECTEARWRAWTAQGTVTGPYADEIRSSLVVLKGLIYGPTGGVAAAATTSLPEQIGGDRNWDYRYCWLRDASMTMTALVEGGYREEAAAWRDWLLRAVAGDPDQLQIMYGVDGRRRLPEATLDWLPGYEASRPVRLGNGAFDQYQLDVPGEVMDALRVARAAGLQPDPHAWAVTEVVLDHVAANWRKPDEGIWEVRGGAQHFTYSKVMAWVAADRAALLSAFRGQKAEARKWRSLADEIQAEVLARAFDERRNTFVQAYGSTALDASLLQLPLVGFLPMDDPRISGTIAAVEQALESDGFVARYRVEDAADDGLTGSEGAFLICSFWLIQAVAMQGRIGRARELLERMLELRNDVGLLSEEYDPANQRMLGNMPQAFSHIGLVNAALACHDSGGSPDAGRGGAAS